MGTRSKRDPLASGREDATRRPFTAVLVDARGEDEARSLADVRPTLSRWCRSGLAVGVVCSRRGAAALPDHQGLAVVVDDARDPRPSLEGTVRLYGEVTLRLDAGPTETLVVAHTAAAVAAARALGFRRIVGVEGNAAAGGLLEAGARTVVEDVRGLRFPRLLPPGLESVEEIERRCAGRSPAVFLDFDGTIAPIVADPAEARLAPEMRDTLEALAERCPVAVLSGRDREDVARRTGLAGIFYAGSHGLDIAGPGRQFAPDGALAAAPALRAAAGDLGPPIGGIAGALLEIKQFSVAVHYRRADPEDAERLLAVVDEVAARHGLRVRQGKQVRELLPDLPWHKGRALEWLRDALELDPLHTCLFYIGDDETDEDAFQALGPGGIGLRPGPRVAASLADYHLKDVAGVQQFLGWLVATLPHR